MTITILQYNFISLAGGFFSSFSSISLFDLILIRLLAFLLANVTHRSFRLAMFGWHFFISTPIFCALARLFNILAETDHILRFTTWLPDQVYYFA